MRAVLNCRFLGGCKLFHFGILVRRVKDVIWTCKEVLEGGVAVCFILSGSPVPLCVCTFSRNSVQHHRSCSRCTGVCSSAFDHLIRMLGKLLWQLHVGGMPTRRLHSRAQSCTSGALWESTRSKSNARSSIFSTTGTTNVFLCL